MYSRMASARRRSRTCTLTTWDVMGWCLAVAWHCAGHWPVAACGREAGAALQAWVGVGAVESHCPQSAGCSCQPVRASWMSLSTWQGGPLMNMMRHHHLTQLCPAAALFCMSPASLGRTVSCHLHHTLFPNS